MPFIDTVPEYNAPEGVGRMYEKVIGKLGYISNYSRVFSHRPEVMEQWGNLQRVIRSSMDTRRYELVTLAAARALKSSYCMLAHGSVLSREFPDTEQLRLIATDHRQANLTPAEIAMMTFAEKVVQDASAISEVDVEELRKGGFSDAEIFDIAATAAARCFFSKILDALGAEPDDIYLDLEVELRRALTVGRPIATRPDGRRADGV